MAEERFGNLGPQDFRDMRAAAAEVANLAAEQQKVLLALGQTTGTMTGALQQQARAARDLAGYTAETLKSKEGLQKLTTKQTQLTEALNKLQTEERDRAKEVERLANSVSLQRQRALSLTGQTKVAAEQELLIRESALTAAQEGLDINREAVKSSRELLKNTEALIQAKKVLDSQTVFFDKLLQVVNSIPGLGPALQGPFQGAATAAKTAAEQGAGKLRTYMTGTVALASGLAALLGPAAILKSLFSASDQTAQINRQLGLGIEASRKVRENFAQIAQDSASSRFNTEKLLKANADLNQALGTSTQFSGETLKSFIQLTEYMGVSVEAASKLSALGTITGRTSGEFAGNLALSVANANRANGVFVSTTTALDKIKNLTATTLLNLRRNPEAIGQAIVATEKLGMSFEQLRSTANSLLDFESSIQNELEAELLVGRQINFERARSAALRGDDVALAKELATQVGTVSQFERMNVIQRESIAKAFGMSADQMGDMLLKQELLNKLGGQAKDLTNEQAAAIKKMVDENPGMTPQQALLQLQSQESAAKKFEDAVAKLRNVFVDIVAFLSPIVDKFGGAISQVASSDLARALLGGGMVVSLGLALRNAVAPRGSSPLNPMYVTSGGIAGNRALIERFGSASAARTMTRMPAYGGAAALLGAGLMSSDNEGAQAAGGFLTGAGTGVMAGSAFGLHGMVIGGVLGGLVGVVASMQKREEKREETQEDKYDEMIKLMRAQAESEVAIYMDSTKVGQQLVTGGYQTNGKVNHT